MTPQEIDERINRLSKGKCVFMQKILQQVGAEEKQLLNKTTKTMDYKFRGKCTQSKKWVTGFYYYCKTDRKHFILSLSTNLIAGKERQEEIIVDPETVGQYTGFQDQNERDIYKDDVILVHQFLFDGAEIEKEFKGVVVWIAAVGSYGVKVIDQMDNNFLDYTGYENLEEMPPFTFSSLYGLHEESFEVIGNIHENPELLNND